MALPEESRQLIQQVAAALGPAPPDDPVAAAKVQELLAKLERRYQEEAAKELKRSGLNMILPKEVAGANAGVTVFGHVPGVKPGAKFKDRGQLYVAGVHATIMKGIHAPPARNPDFERGAYSIVMSGGYVDDEDMGESFWYTGEGGIDAGTKQQVKDQSFDKGANAALRNNCDTRTPVRVVRGFLHGGGGGADAASEGQQQQQQQGGKKEKGFVYEGLYVVLQYKREPSKDGPLVCKYLMHGVPGHSMVNAKVEFGIFGGVPTGGRLHARRLAGGTTGEAQAVHPAKRARLERNRKAAEAARKAMLEEIRARYPASVLHSEDVSGGQEAVPIPLINEVSDERLPESFQYIREYSWAPGVYQLVAPVLKFADEEMAEFTVARQHGACGIAFNRHLRQLDLAMGEALPPGYEAHMEEQYNTEGCLMVTDPCGVHECGEACSAAKCRNNKQLSNGVVLPLEVFMTAAKGWGVRCRERVPPGAFVCAYVGQLVTDAMAEVRKGVDNYLFNLDFFSHIYTEIAEKGLKTIADEIPLHKIPPVLSVDMVRQLQANAAAAVRTAPPPAAAAPAATVADAGAAGPSTSAAATANGAAQAVNGTTAEAVEGADFGFVQEDDASGGGGRCGGAADAAAAGPSGRQPGTPGAGTAAAAAAAAGATRPRARAGTGPAVGPDGVLPREEVQAAAREFASTCSALAAERSAPGAEAGPGSGSAAQGGHGGADPRSPASQPGMPAAAKAAALTSTAAAAAEAAAADPGAFYMQPIFSREEHASPGPGGRAPATEAAGATAAAGEEDEYCPILVIDARSTGNVGRFINHSCDGNLTIQAVFAGHYRNTLLYHVGLYANQEIPPGVELSYNYGYHSQANRTAGQAGMECHCGAPNCVGRLL